MKLYELKENYMKVLSMIDTEEDTRCIMDTLEAIQGEAEEKIESIAKMVKTIQADEAIIKAEEERLYKRREALENKRESIKNYLEDIMLTMNIDKVKTPILSVAIQNNPPSIKLYYECTAMFPKEYEKVVYSLDKKKMLEDLKAGKVIQGAEIQQTKGVRIR